MKVLIACEESQTSCIAFRNLGHIAYSCDLQDCSGGFPEWHIKGDCWDVIEFNNWDLIIAHPPCTYLSIAGACNMYKNGIIDNERYERMLVARDFFMRFYNLSGVRLCIENPRAMKMANLPPYSQTIQPFEFGDPYTKLTLLWLKDLPLLFPQVYSVNKRIAPSCVSWVGTHHGSVQRSKSFAGISAAMAKQWGDL